MIRALGADQRAKAACGTEQTSARTCVATRAVRPPKDLIRFVAGPDSEIVPDIAHKLPGRGIWVTCHRDAVQRAVAKHAFPRALRRKVRVEPDLATRVEGLLIRRALDHLSICNKAGLVLCGLGKVNSWLEAGANGAFTYIAWL